MMNEHVKTEKRALFATAIIVFLIFFSGCSARKDADAGRDRAIASGMDAVKERVEHRSKVIRKRLSGRIEIIGTVSYVPLEGGFYAIRGDDGMNYDPMNLPAAFRKDGLRVRVKGVVMRDAVSFHMYGTIIKIIEIEPVSKGPGQGDGALKPRIIPSRD